MRSFAVMQGYWEAPGDTERAVDDDGWLHTGDVATIDGAGNVTIVGRTKEVFIVNGFNVYPAEVENLLLRHAAVDQAAVVPVDDGDTGEAGVAFVVPTAGVIVDPTELLAWARRSMANYKVPRHVEVVDELPVGTTGKVDRSALRARWLAAQHVGAD